MSTAPNLPHQGPKDNLAGAAYVVLCCVLLAATTLIARVLGPQIAGEHALHPIQVTWARFFFGAATIVPIALFRGHSLISPNWRLHLGRVIAGLGGVVGMFAAAGLMPLSEATAISFLSPLFAMVLAVLFLRETVGPWRWGAAAIAFGGSMILTRPGSEAFQPAALIAFGAAIFMGAELIFIKALSGREPALKILGINNGMAAVFASCAVLFVWKMPTSDQWILMVVLGMTMVCAQSFFLKGITLAEANVAAPFFYTTLIFATLYGWILFGEIPNRYTVSGAVLIVLGAVILAWRERLAKKR